MTGRLYAQAVYRADACGGGVSAPAVVKKTVVADFEYAGKAAVTARNLESARKQSLAKARKAALGRWSFAKENLLGAMKCQGEADAYNLALSIAPPGTPYAPINVSCAGVPGVEL